MDDGFTNGLTDMSGFLVFIIMRGDPTITEDGSGIPLSVGTGSPMILGDGAHTITAGGTGEQVSVGTGFLRGFGDRVGSTGTGDMIISVGVH